MNEELEIYIKFENEQEMINFAQEIQNIHISAHIAESVWEQCESLIK